MTNGNGSGNGNGHDDPFDDDGFEAEPAPKRELVRIVDDVNDFRQAAQGRLIDEIESLLRNQPHYDEVKPYVLSVAGMGPSIFGSAKFDEAGCMFHIKRFADANGYPLMAKATVAEIAPATKRAFTRIGMPWKLIRKQGVLNRIEQRRALKDDRPEAAE